MAKWIVRQTDRYLSSQTGRQIDRLAVRQNSIRADIERWTVRQADEPERQEDRQTN